MAQGKKSIVVYADWISIFSGLEDDEAGRLIKHFFQYVNDTDPEPPDRLTKLLFEPIKQTLKRDLKKYEGKKAQNAANARKRWEIKNTIASNGIQSDAKHADSDSDSDSDSDRDININNKKNNYKTLLVNVISKNKIILPGKF